MNNPEQEKNLGTIENPIIDSALSETEALAQNPEKPAPPEVLERQRVVDVKYFGVDGKYHQGQIIVDQELVEDVRKLFELILEQQIPLQTVVPVADPKFRFDDKASMAENNSSGYNFRDISNTGKISHHAAGRAIDLNPKLNPWLHDDIAEPSDGAYDPAVPGTWSENHPIVQFLESRGWTWGGHFKTMKDYHHFQKPLPE